MLNKLTVTELAELSKLSKPYISQVKNGKRPPSEKLLESLKQLCQPSKKELEITKALDLFLKSRRDGVSNNTIIFYRKPLSKALPILGLSPSPNQLNSFFNSLSCSQGGKHGYYRAISVFFNWLYSYKSGFDYRLNENPIKLIDPPKRPKLIMPSLSKEQVSLLIDKAHCLRDKAIISLFAESGLRLSELVNIKTTDINWESQIIKVIGKGSKEGYAPFGNRTKGLLQAWISQHNPDGNHRLWDIGFWGVKTVLDELTKETGIKCNPHTFRRTFACLLRKAGVDTMTIKDLGRWESLEMVQRYTRSVTFQDSLKFYKAPLS